MHLLALIPLPFRTILSYNSSLVLSREILDPSTPIVIVGMANLIIDCYFFPLLCYIFSRMNFQILIIILNLIVIGLLLQ